MLVRLASAVLALALAVGGFALPSGAASAAEPLPTQLALAMPLTVPPETTGLIPAEILETYTSPTGILTRQLDAVINRQVAIALDPMIVASIRILGNTAPETAIDWLDRLATASNETFALSYADSDLAALSQAGSTSILAPTWFPIDPGVFPVDTDEPEETPTATPAPGQTTEPEEPVVPTSETLDDWPYTIESVIWPRAATVIGADLATFNAGGEVTTLLSSANVATAGAASATAEGMPVLVSDDTLSSLLADAAGAFTDLEWQAAFDRFATALASWSNDHSTELGTLLATFERNPLSNVNRLAETIAAISQLPNTQLVGLNATMSEQPDAIRLVDLPVDAERISRMRLLLAAEALIGPFSTVLNDPAPLTGERRLSLLALASNSWMTDQAGWTAAVDEWLARTNTILTSVQIAESSTLNFGQEKGNLPISISNGLDFPVTVYVTVTSGTGILVALQSRVPLTLEANSQGRAFIPVQSIANGVATLQVSLSSNNGVAIGTPKQVTTNVVAGWETAATVIIAVLLLVIFIAGIVRTVLKRRRAIAAQDASPDSPGTGE